MQHSQGYTTPNIESIQPLILCDLLVIPLYCFPEQRITHKVQVLLLGFKDLSEVDRLANFQGSVVLIGHLDLIPPRSYKHPACSLDFMIWKVKAEVKSLLFFLKRLLLHLQNVFSNWECWQLANAHAAAAAPAVDEYSDPLRSLLPLQDNLSTLLQPSISYSRPKTSWYVTSSYAIATR